MTLAIAAAPARIVLALSPFEAERRVVEIPGDEHTVGQVIDGARLPRHAVYVSVDGTAIDVERWDETLLLAGSSTLVQIRPGGPVGAIVSAWLGFTGVAAQIAAAVINVVLHVGLQYGVQIGLQRLLAESPPEIQGSDPGIRTTISGARNELKPYAPLPQVLGEHRSFPPLAAASYTTVEDGKLVQYCLFTFGHGPLALAELKIGDEPLFTEGTTLVYTGQMTADADAFNVDGKAAATLELRQGGGSDAAITLFATDIQDQIVSVRLRDKAGTGSGKRSGPWVRRTTLDRAVGITIIVGCPGGLVRITDTGKLKDQRSVVDIRYRAVGATTWTNVQEIRMVEHTRNSVYASRTWAVSEGTYEVECRWQTDRNDGDPGILDETHWASMLVSRSGSPVRQSGLCLVAARFVITANFASLVNQLNGVPTTICPDWDADTSTWITRATSNPASLFRHVLQGGACRRPATDAQISLTKLAAWHVECAAKGFTFRHVTQGASTVRRMLDHIAAAGRAQFAIHDGKYSVVTEPDTATTAPSYHLGPHNSQGFRGRRRFDVLPHALRVQWVDPESGYLDTERIVPDDGYTETSATKFDRLELVGVASAEQAYKLGRYRIAERRLRREEYELEVGFEHLAMLRGDWGYVTHDVALFGLARGRVVSVTMSGADCVGVVVNQECPMAAATYGIRFRLADGTSLQKNVTTAAGNQTALTFASAIASGDPMPEPGDWFAFGEAGSETVKMIIQSIEPGDDLTARIVLIDAAPGVLTADAAAIPRYDPQITLPPPATPLAPPKPQVASATSAPSRSATSATVRISLAPQRAAVQR